MPKNQHRTPTYRLHKPTHQAVTRIDGKDHYLGRHGTAGSKRRYDQLIAEWLSNERTLPDTSGEMTVTEVLVAYWRFATGYYVKDGEPTSEINSIKYALKVLRKLYGTTTASEFGPLKLKAVREQMIAADWSRKYVNDQIDRIKRAFRWAAENEFVTPDIYDGLRTLRGLRKGRSAARETAPVRPVADEFVNAIRPHVSGEVWAMVELMRLSGARAGEIVLMRGADLDMTGKTWTYTPQRHKTQHHDKPRTIYLGPQAQKSIREFLHPDTEAYLFAPQHAEAARNEVKRRSRGTPMTPSHRKRAVTARRRKRRRPPGDHYTTDTLRRCITRACDRADAAAKEAKGLPLDGDRIVPRWHLHQLRHSAATRIRREFGIEIARAVLGHSSPSMTAVYAEFDGAKAADVMAKIG